MLETKKVVLTYEGLKKMEEELEELKTVKRKEIAEKIKEARGQGDLSENAEYDSAKEEQAEIEGRIIKLEKLLRNAEIIDEEDLRTDIISIGSHVILFDAEFQEDVEYAIVGSAEADPLKGKLSNESPVGSALIGCKVGDKIEIDVPEGKIQYTVKEIQ